MIVARTGNAVLEDIGSAVSRWRGAEAFLSQTGITVRASDPAGFDMALLIESGRFVLAFDEWVEEFDDAATARRLFSAALAGTARLKVSLLAGRKWRWTLECLDDEGNWKPESTVGRAIWLYWGKPSIIYLCNSFRAHT